jgi:hypothetical protein
MSDPGQLGGYVRNWLHYDTLASSLYKQANRARQVRDDFELKVLDELRNQRMENAVIQINNGTLSVVEERNPRSLSLVRIEEILHKYFHKKGHGQDETKEIMNYIRGNRGYDVSKKIKKSGGPNLPPLPPPPGTMVPR